MSVVAIVACGAGWRFRDEHDFESSFYGDRDACIRSAVACFPNALVVFESDAFPPAMQCKCSACGTRVRWHLPDGMSPRRFLAPIRCSRCGERAIHAEIPSDEPTTPELEAI